MLVDLVLADRLLVDRLLAGSRGRGLFWIDAVVEGSCCGLKLLWRDAVALIRDWFPARSRLFV